DHPVDVRHHRGPRRRQLLVRRVRQPRAPHRQDRRARRQPPGV
ncbi:MAG: Putative sortase (Surface protein transpeptidase), partial [uncultured Nocardioides sp.]